MCVKFKPPTPQTLSVQLIGIFNSVHIFFSFFPLTAPGPFSQGTNEGSKKKKKPYPLLSFLVSVPGRGRDEPFLIFQPLPFLSPGVSPASPLPHLIFFIFIFDPINFLFISPIYKKTLQNDTPSTAQKKKNSPQNFLPTVAEI